MVKREQRREPHPPSQAWGDIGATLARIGAPIEVFPVDVFDPFEPELPLQGGIGEAPQDIEMKRHVAAVIRKLYDDVFDYALEEPVPEPTPEPEPSPAVEPTPEPAVKFEAFNRKTGKPIKLKVNMVPGPQAEPPAQAKQPQSG